MTGVAGAWPYAALAAGIVLGVIGQVLLKAGAIDASDLAVQLCRPATLGGLVLYALAAFAYLVALRRLPVSIAFPSVSLSYVVVAVLGRWLWQEPLGWPQISGLVLITAGVLLIHQH